MAELETYVTKENPDVEDWLEYNKDLFATLNGLKTERYPHYAPFVDVDRCAVSDGVSVEEYYEKIKTRVGILAKATLRLVHSEMDDAWHITVEPTQAAQTS